MFFASTCPCCLGRIDLPSTKFIRQIPQFKNLSYLPPSLNNCDPPIQDMRALLPRGSRLAKRDLHVNFSWPNGSFAPSWDSICVACQFRAFQSSGAQGSRTRAAKFLTDRPLRSFSTHPRLPKDDLETPRASSSVLQPPSTGAAALAPKSTSVHQVPDEQLPSHRENQRWTLSKRFHRMMDDLMPKLAIASQKINNYTGSDYSGIEALRREIKEQGTGKSPGPRS